MKKKLCAVFLALVMVVSSASGGALYSYEWARSNVGWALGWEPAVVVFVMAPVFGLFSGCCFGWRYEDSAIPGWDVQGMGGASYGMTGYEMGAGGFELESDTISFNGGVVARRDNLAAIANARFGMASGSGDMDGADSSEVGVSGMAAYRVLEQDADGVDVYIHALADLSTVDNDGIDEQLRAALGGGASVRHTSDIGSFRAAYMLSHNHVLDGPEDITGDDFLNIHGARVDYTALVVEDLYGTAGIQYTSVMDAPDGATDSFADLVADLNYGINESWVVSGGVSTSIDGNGNTGVRARAGYRW